MKLFYEHGAVDALVKANGCYDGCHFHIREMVTTGFQTGVSLFKDVWVACAKEFFLAELMNKLTELESGSFADDDVAAFNAVLEGRAAQLKKVSGNRKLKWQCEFEFFGDVLALHKAGHLDVLPSMYHHRHKRAIPLLGHRNS